MAALNMIALAPATRGKLAYLDIEVDGVPLAVRWTDWAYENGREPAGSITWPTRPGNFLFERGSYEQAIREASARETLG